MACSYKVYDAIAKCPADDWNHVCRAARANVFMSIEFISVVESSFAGESRFWHVIVYDEQAVPIACASVCTFMVDLLTLADSGVKRAAQVVRRYLPDCGRIKVLFCGLPVSVGQSQLVMSPGANRDDVVRQLDHVIADDLARTEGARLIVYKEFDADASESLASLVAAGYRRVESPASYIFDGGYKDFDDYCGALKSHYRNDIRRSQRKFRQAGLTVMHLTDPDDILRLYDDTLHRLYEAVVEKSTVKLELLPIGFFRALVTTLPNQVSLTLVRSADRVVAFNWGLHDGTVFYFLFCGMDYSSHGDADLYFNLMYHALDFALGRAPEYISIGQTADSFKSRLGCRPHSLYMFVKGVGPVLSRVIPKAAGVLFPEWPIAQGHSILRSPTGRAVAQGRAR